MTAERTVSMSFRVTPKFRRLLVAAAEKQNRSLTNMLETLLFEFCAENGIDDSTEELERESPAPEVARAKAAVRPKAKRRS